MKTDCGVTTLWEKANPDQPSLPSPRVRTMHVGYEVKW